ncbi:MAG TPA: PilZ domain-containing protein [bacterium]|nr:PilZ domain-containing protein [bacterium]HPS28677.1 PilZ domain-containing protein [bacterium]
MGKRKLIRVNYKVDAIVNINNIRKKCSVRDISLSGIYLNLSYSVEIGEKATITVQVVSDSTSGEIVLSGIVVRKDAEGVAFEFSEIPLDSYLFLRNVLVYNLGDPESIDSEYRRHLASRKMKSANLK